jgi:5-formyltetrahydrofolate cyclo-ligase
MTKSELRKLFIQRRRSMSPTQHAEASHLITEQLFESIDLNSVSAVNCFVSLRHKGEVETQEIFERIWNEYAHVRTFAPRINERIGELESVPIARKTLLTENKWKIREPEGEAADASILDLAIVPMLCFDNQGHRVGYGKGFYDEFLARCRPDCQKVGVCFFPPVERIDDYHAGDVRLDLCITPSGSLRF